MSKDSSREWEKCFDERDVADDFYTVDGNGLNDWMSYDIDKIKDFIHQELQKARQDWLREEIVKLEGEKQVPNPNKKLPIVVASQIVLYNDALQTIIDRYQSELDQPIS